MASRKQQLASLHTQGFDRSCILREGFLKVRCSQCEATFVNGIPCHETGCPNTVHECKGCNNPVVRKGAYCEDCR